jgi:nitroreductase
MGYGANSQIKLSLCADLTVDNTVSDKDEFWGEKLMELYDVMRTTFAAREFTDAPVTDVMLQRILDNARFAPSGGNRQGWKVVVVRNEQTRQGLAEIMRPGMQRYVAQVKAGEAPYNSINPSQVSDAEVANTQVPQQMLDNLTQAPVILLIFVDLSVVASFDSHLDRVGVISGASIYPFVWNILLAARSEGLGGTLTTFACGQEAKLRELIGVPEEMAFSAMIPLGQPVKQLTKLKRKDVQSFTVLEHWSGENLVGS